MAIEEIRFAEYFSPEYFSRYLEQSNKWAFKKRETDDMRSPSGVDREETNRRHSTERVLYTESVLVALPADDDPMLERVRALRIRDQMFIDNLQTDYDLFRNQMDGHYLAWQREAYAESNAARKAQTAANVKKIVGVLAIIGAAVAIANSSYYDSTPAAVGTLAAVLGVHLVRAGMSDSLDAKIYRDSLNELGKQINFEMASRVMQMEDTTIALKGTASEQYTAWRDFLHKFYEKDKTPDVIL